MTSPTDETSSNQTAALISTGVEHLTFDVAGLVPVVVQEVSSSAVLMLAWANREAISQTLRTGRATYFSRSRNEIWVKGETSSHVQWVHDVAVDCDGDAILYRVRQVGPACHTGRASCFDSASLSVAVSDPQAPIHDNSCRMTKAHGNDEIRDQDS